MSQISEFELEKKANIKKMANDANLHMLTNQWFVESCKHKYTYNFTWMGRPIIQYPQDIIALQEILMQVKPDLVIETGIAHGGSIIFSASMLELIGKGEVLGIDIDIREHNRLEIEKHSMFKRINLIEGDSISDEVLNKVRLHVEGKDCILVILDSMHTYDHVLKELELYSKFVTKNSYLIVFDTVIEDMPDEFFKDRPWGKDNNPKMAVREFLKTNGRFEIDKQIENKLLITVAPDGYLKCIKE